MTHPLRQEITDIVMGSSLRGMYNTGWEDKLLALIDKARKEGATWGMNYATRQIGTIARFMNPEDMLKEYDELFTPTPNDSLPA